jgi:hypothetical protein
MDVRPEVKAGAPEENQLHNVASTPVERIMIGFRSQKRNFQLRIHDDSTYRFFPLY